MSETQPVNKSMKPVAALYNHCKEVYAVMLEKSDDGVYEGFLTKEFKDLHLSTPYYTAVTNALKGMGCIEQRRRGGGSASSEWAIVREPTEDLFRDWQESEKDKKGGRTATPGTIDQLFQMNRDFNNRLQRVEEALGFLSPQGASDG